MKRALTLAALASLALTSSNLENFSDDEFKFLKSIGKGLKKAGEFVVKHPKIITTAVKILALEDSLEDDNDVENELYYRIPPQNYKKQSQPLPKPQSIKNYINFDDISDQMLAATKPAPQQTKPTMIQIDAKPDFQKKYLTFDEEEFLDEFLAAIKPVPQQNKPTMTPIKTEPSYQKKYLTFDEEEFLDEFLAAIKPVPQQNKPTMTPIKAEPRYQKKYLTFDEEEVEDNSLLHLDDLLKEGREHRRRNKNSFLGFDGY